MSGLKGATGEVTWSKAPDQAAVLQKTVSMGQMTSMLHDTDRNGVYERALERCLAHFKDKCGRAPSVLDVGTGTGLLAMLAVRHGAEVVVGCEMFETMAEIAQTVVAQNGLDGQVTIMAAKSSQLELGGHADVLVSELLDSALLGEGCLVSHADAIRRLIAPADAVGGLPVSQRVMPNRATVYATLLDCPGVQGYGRVRDEWFGATGTTSAHRRPEDRQCRAGGGLPVHYERLRDSFGSKELSARTRVLDVNFWQAPEEGDEAFLGKTTVELEVTATGQVSTLVVWWDLFLLDKELDPLGELMYSSAPNAQNWQDHWVQMIYPLPEPIEGCAPGDRISVTLGHDAMHLWLIGARRVDPVASPASAGAGAGADVGGPAEKRLRVHDDNADADYVEPPRICCCGWHLLYGPERMLQLDDSARCSQWEKAMVSVRRILSDTHLGERGSGSDINIVLDVSDGSLLTLMIGDDIAHNRKMVSLESKDFSRMLHGQLVDSNGRKNAMVWDGVDFDDVGHYFEDEGVSPERSTCEEERPALRVSVAALVCECFFYQLPTLPLWAAIKFLYMRSSSAVHSRLAPGAPVVPCRARLMAAPVQLTDLHVSHGMAGVVSGFDHSVLDGVQSGWSQHNFPYSMGGYAHTMLSAPTSIAELDYMTGFFEGSAAMGRSTVLDVGATGTCHAVALWVDYDLCDGVALNLRDDASGKFPLHAKTMLRFLPQPQAVQAGKHKLTCDAKLAFGDSDFTLDFRME